MELSTWIAPWGGAAWGAPAAAAPRRRPVSSRVLPLDADVVTSAHHVRVVVDLPGVRPEDLAVELDRGVLTIGGTRRPPYEGGRLLDRGTAYGAFAYRVQLPVDADPDGVHARLEGGVLAVEVARRREEPRRVPVLASRAAPSVWARLAAAWRRWTAHLRRAFA